MKSLFISIVLLFSISVFAQEPVAKKKETAEASIASLLYLPTLGHLSLSLGYEGSFTSYKLKSSSGTVTDNIEGIGNALRFEGVFGLGDNVALSLTAAQSDRRVEITPVGGTKTTVKGKGVNDVGLGIVFRFMESTESRPYELRASLKHYPTFGKVKSMGTSEDGNLSPGYAYSILSADILGGRGMWEYDGTVAITPGVKATAENTSGSSTSVDKGMTIGVMFASQLNFTPKFSLLGKLGLSLTGSSEDTSSSGTVTKTDSYSQSTLEVGIKYLFTENFYLTSGLAIDAIGEVESTTAGTKSKIDNASQSTLKIVGITYAY